MKLLDRAERLWRHLARKHGMRIIDANLYMSSATAIAWDVELQSIGVPNLMLFKGNPIFVSEAIPRGMLIVGQL